MSLLMLLKVNHKGDFEMRQYESCVPGEYLKDLLEEISVVSGIPIDYGKVEEAAKNDGEPGEHCVCIFRKNDSFILVDVQNIDWLKGFVIRCQDDIAVKVKAIVLKWDVIARKHYHQEIPTDIEDAYGKERSLLNDIIKGHKLKNI